MNRYDKVYPQQIVDWLSAEIKPNKLVFDEVMYIHDRIIMMLDNNELELRIDNKLFVLKLALYIYQNSDKNPDKINKMIPEHGPQTVFFVNRWGAILKG